MKKWIAMALACVMAASAMTGCSSHTHTATGDWIVDAAGHWKQCSECEEKAEAGAHEFGDDFRCTACNSEVMEWEEGTSVYTYDRHNNIRRMAEYDTKGVLISELAYEYKYDPDGNVIGAMEYTDGVLTGERICTVIDGLSMDTKYTTYNEDGGKFVNEYDENGNCVKAVEYDADGQMVWEANSQYFQTLEGEWYECACTETYSDGTMTEARYDEDGHNLSWLMYDSAGVIIEDKGWAYIYDSDDNIEKVMEFENGVHVRDLLYKYITDGDGGSFGFPEIVTEYHTDGCTTVFVYDENGELVRETTYDPDGGVVY